MKLEDFDFRLWSNEAESYVDINVHLEIGKASMIPRDTGTNIETIELWSGLYDKHGTKIYEGDIVQNDRGKRYAIKYELAGFMLYDKNDLRDMALFQLYFMNVIGRNVEHPRILYIEIIGNIHEDKELLESKEEACK